MDITFNDLEEAALAVIQDIQSFNEYKNQRLTVCGGMAVVYYTQSAARTTKDVDFYTSIPGAPGEVKRKLANAYPERYTSPAVSQVFCYQAPNGKEIQIDLVPDWQVPYKPHNTPRVKDLSPDDVPYLDVEDLMAFKVNACGLRGNAYKSAQDAYDAINLKEIVEFRESTLTHEQKTAIRDGLSDVVNTGATSEEDWNNLLN